MLFYGVDPTDVPERDRPALWAQMDPVLKRDGSGDTFAAVQFRDEEGNVVLGIEESC